MPELPAIGHVLALTGGALLGSPEETSTLRPTLLGAA